MRALPLVERVLIIGFGILLLAVLGFLLVWHLRYRAMMAAIAESGPRPGMPTVPAPVACDPTLAAATAHWLDSIPADAQLYDGLNDDDCTDAVTDLDVLGRPDPPSGMRALHGLLARGLRFDYPPLPATAPEPVPPDYVGFDPVGGASIPSPWYVDFPESDRLQDCLLSAGVMWAYDARVAATAQDGLADLDALNAAASCPSDRSWLTIGFCLSRIRDGAQLAAALLHSCPETTTRRWHDQPCNVFPMLLEESCRQRFVDEPAGMVPLFAKGPFSYISAYPHPLADLPGAWSDWWNVPMRVSAVSAAHASYEDDLIARRCPGSQREMWSAECGAFGLSYITLPAQALRTLTYHRLAVLAVDALAQRGPGGDFPEHLDLDLAARSDLPPLTCLHDRRRLIIAIDLSHPLPPYLAAAFPYGGPDDLGALFEALRFDPTRVEIDLDILAENLADAANSDPVSSATAPVR